MATCPKCKSTQWVKVVEKTAAKNILICENPDCSQKGERFEEDSMLVRAFISLGNISKIFDGISNAGGWK
jgi:transcription elongation factor Elf1